ncbi:MAG TPA: Uma2 family endonuclease [Bryobacteraceae bacterium]|nr:Uma2 family endonuclease [Bryobacteraceae bacterium]
MSTKTLITAAELEQMPDDDSVRIELDEGELLTMPPAGLDHGDFESNIVILLGAYVKKHRLGGIYTGDTGFRLRDDTVRCPDVSFVRRERVPAIRRRGFGDGAPDLAVEIFSPSDSVRQLMRKVKQYFAAGCHTVWVVYPEQREINVLEASGADRLLKADDVIEAPELLPGFSARVGEFFGD